MASHILKVEEENRIGISVRNLTVEANSLAIINDVSFDLNSGELLAIMGGSGLGKTTLLNVLCQRTNITDKKLKFLGLILYDKADTDVINYSYMQQTDSFLPGLTVFETLKTQSDLRMPPSVSEGAKLELINELLKVLELEHKRDTVIATFGSHRTFLSGGEQRRVLVAIQLLSRPRILFLDEPTTGLDTLSSLKLVQTLKKLASPEIGLTVVLSIHQPRPEISVMFDKLCLLSKGGRLVYFGLLADLVPYFELLGHSLKGRDITHMDFIINLSVKDSLTKEREEASEQRIQELSRAWKQHQQLKPIDSPPTLETLLKLFKKHYPISFWRELVVLTKRTALLTVRDKLLLLSLNLGMAFLGAVTGWMFYKPGLDLAGVRTRTSSIYVMLEVVGFCPLYFEVERLWSTDGVFFLREYLEGYVLIPGFVISRRLGKLFLEDVPIGVLFGLISYFMYGLRGGGHYFGIYITVCILINMVGMATGLLIFAVLPDFVIASLVYGAIYQLQNSACGYFVNSKTMPVYVRWLKYCAYFWYAFGALTSNQYTGWLGECPYDDPDWCIEFGGDYQLSVLEFPQNWIAEPIGILVVWWFGFHLVLIAAFYLRKNDIAMAKQKKNKFGGEDERPKEKNQDGVSPTKLELLTLGESWLPVSIHVSDVTLQTRRKNVTLLDNIACEFKAATVNAIMGPSGGGKTTMLNYLSKRLPHEKWTFKLRGDIVLRNALGAEAQVTPAQLKQISAYVTQQDLALQLRLTVRETLYYQAKLRLPVEEHDEIPSIVAQIIRDMGLVDAADTMIGSAYVKGISGGEKRRVLIAVQLLLKPKILFLDEPTSGLDSTTSALIVGLLHRFALNYGTTIIMTIHQPSQKLFDAFGSLLLLARGGRVVYNGPPTDVVPRFETYGHQKPQEVLDADFLLDVLQSSPETASELVAAWTAPEKPHPELPIKAAPGATFDLAPYAHKKVPFSVSWKTVTKRQWICIFRNKDILWSRAGQTFFLTVVHTLFFAPLRTGPGGLENRMGLIQEVLNLYYVGIINNIAVFPTERDMFFQEYRDGIYGVAEFSIQYFLNELPTEVTPAFIFSILIVFGVGLPRNAGMFFLMFCMGALSINTGELFGMIVNAIISHMGLATNILLNSVILAIFMGGTMSLYMPGFFKAVNYISPMKYAVGICAKVGFPKDLVFDCGLPHCSLNTGKEILDYYKLNINLGGYFGGIVTCFVAYRILGILALWIRVRFIN